MKKKAISILLTATLLASCGSVVFTDRKQLLLYSDSQITSLSDQSYKDFTATAKVSANKAQATEVREVGRRMTAALETYLAQTGQTSYLNGLKWEFSLVQSKEVNAFCLPNGKIVFYEGIMSYCTTPDYIAVVMGHEMAHAVARHGNERMSQEAIASQIEGAINEAIKNKVSLKNRAIFDVAFGLGSKYGVLLPYSRRHEYEADEIGLLIMAIAGYNIEKAPEFWEKMSAGGGAAVPEFMSTHPSDANRIANLRTLIETSKSYK